MSSPIGEEETGEIEHVTKGAQPEILVIGAGGAGCNTINRMTNTGGQRTDKMAINTDAQDLLHTESDQKIMIGRETTGGLGTGSDVRKGKQAAKEDKENIKEAISKYELVFVTCGLGGGTGTGAGPVIAEIAKNLGALTVGVVTLPFEAEGEKRNRNAMNGLSEFKRYSDTTIVIPDDKLLEIAPKLSLEEAFKLADSVLVDTISGITDMMSETGLINLDFEDVRTTFEDGGMGVVGFGEASGGNRAMNSVEEALNNPLLDMKVKNATRALISITGSPDMTLEEAETVAGRVSEELSPDAKVAWGALVSDELEDTLVTMVIVSGAKEFEGKTEVVDLGLEEL